MFMILFCVIGARTLNAIKIVCENSSAETMSIVCNLPPKFASSSPNKWTDFIENMEKFFALNEIRAEERLSYLLQSIDEGTREIVEELYSPHTLEAMSYADIVELLNRHFSRKTVPSVFRQRCLFYNSHQRSNETITEWYIRLKMQSLNCNFGANSANILTDRFLSGLISPTLATHFLEDMNGYLWTGLNLDDIVERFTATYCAIKSSDKRPASPGAVNCPTPKKPKLY